MDKGTETAPIQTAEVVVVEATPLPDPADPELVLSDSPSTGDPRAPAGLRVPPPKGRTEKKRSKKQKKRDKAKKGLEKATAYDAPPEEPEVVPADPEVLDIEITPPPTPEVVKPPPDDATDSDSSREEGVPRRRRKKRERAEEPAKEENVPRLKELPEDGPPTKVHHIKWPADQLFGIPETETVESVTDPTYPGAKSEG